MPSLDKHLKPPEKTKGKNKVAEEPSPVKHDTGFCDDLVKGLAELEQLLKAGESARTFFAAVQLIVKKRPKAVILENVYGAPWDMYTKRIFPKICYAANHIKLDSKDYYLPQTRQRGYLVAIDASHIG